jgi:hypothetical protein
MDHFTHITTAEEKLAREIVLNVLYLRPQKMWQNLIPFMFIFDFLRRTAAIRRYTKKYMFPRNLALDVVRQLSSGESKESVASRVQQRIEAELHPLHLASPDLARAYHQVVDRLAEHYDRLMRTQGDSYDELVRSAYPTPGEFDDHLRQLSAAEQEINRAIVEETEAGKSLGADLQLEAEQVAACRRKVLERVFEPAG